MIRLLILDVDGCLTDGRIYHLELTVPVPMRWHTYTSQIIRGRSFSTLDSKGIWLLKESGVSTWICGGDHAPHLLDRLEYLAIDGSMLEPEDKRAILDKFQDLPKESIAFMGNDVQDVGLLSLVGYPACPADAHVSALNVVRSCSRGYVSTRNGGEGAVREFCDFILAVNNFEKWSTENENSG